MYFDHHQLKRLLERMTNGVCVSLYMATSGNPHGAKADAITFKNLLSRAQDELDALGEDDGTALLEPAYDLLRDKSFWAAQQDGLAVFLSGRFFEDFQLPVRFKPRVVVGPRFHLKPLLPLVANNHRFALLAVSRGGAMLYSCTRFGAVEVDVPDMPGSVDEAARVDAGSPPLQQHTGTPGPGRGTMFHGQDRDDAARREDVAKYCRAVDAAARRALGEDAEQRAFPVVFAGGDRLFDVFREASGIKGLLADNVSVNPESLSGERLRDMALPLVEQVFRAGYEADLERYGDRSASELVTDEVADVYRAAVNDRVDTLFVSLEDTVWGRAANGEAAGQVLDQSGDGRRPGDVDVLDMAATSALSAGGRVHVVSRDEVPGGGVAAAILRY